MEESWKEGRRHAVECDLQSLQLVVNRAKSRAVPLKSCEFLSYKLDHRAKLVWTEKAQRRFKERIREPERSGDRLPGGQPREG